MKHGGWIALGVVGLALLYLNRQAAAESGVNVIQYPNVEISNTALSFLDILPMLDNPVPTDINVGTSYV
jgi:hypothetical protein